MTRIKEFICSSFEKEYLEKGIGMIAKKDVKSLIGTFWLYKATPRCDGSLRVVYRAVAVWKDYEGHIFVHLRADSKSCIVDWEYLQTNFIEVTKVASEEVVYNSGYLSHNSATVVVDPETKESVLIDSDGDEVFRIGPGISASQMYRILSIANKFYDLGFEFGSK